MNQELGSIMKSVYDIHSVKVYAENTKEGFERPSLYFPPASTVSGNDTVSTYQQTHVVNVKIFDHDSHAANEQAERIVHALKVKKGLIPLINDDESVSDDFIRLIRVESRISDHGVAILVLAWTSRYYYERETFPSLESIGMNSGVKQ